MSTFEGTIEATPYSILIVPGQGSAVSDASRYLPVAEGNHGVDSQVAALNGKNVQLRGTKIYRNNQKMIEVLTGSISVMGDSKQPRSSIKELGNFELTGEIVDSKCYLGVMNREAARSIGTAQRVASVVVSHQCLRPAISMAVPRSLCSLIKAKLPYPRKYC